MTLVRVTLFTPNARLPRVSPYASWLIFLFFPWPHRPCTPPLSARYRFSWAEIIFVTPPQGAGVWHVPPVMWPLAHCSIWDADTELPLFGERYFDEHKVFTPGNNRSPRIAPSPPFFWDGSSFEAGEFPPNGLLHSRKRFCRDPSDHLLQSVDLVISTSVTTDEALGRSRSTMDSSDRVPVQHAEQTPRPFFTIRYGFRRSRSRRRGVQYVFAP